MTRQTLGQVTIVIGHPSPGTGDTEALKAARSAIFGQLAFLAAANEAAHHTDLYYDAMWLDKFFPGHPVFFFGVSEAGTVIGCDERTVQCQSRRMWRIDTTHRDGQPWTATFTAIGTGHQLPPASPDSGDPR